MRQSTALVLAALAVPLGMALAGCGEKPQPSPKSQAGTAKVPLADPSPAESSEILILCGSSFRPPMEKLVKSYEEETGRRALLAFGGSEDHLPRVKLKSDGDLFVTHTPYQQYTREADALLRDVEVGFLAPVLVAEKGNPKNLKSIDDLAQPGLRVILPNPEFSTCGEMVYALLEKKGIKEKVLENVGNALVRQHAEVAAPIKLGHRDAGIMWNGVAHNWLDSIEIVPVPYEYDEEIRVSVMGLSYSKKQDEVQKFLDFVQKHGPEVFKEFGYVK